MYKFALYSSPFHSETAELSWEGLILLTKSYVPIRIKRLFQDLFIVLLFSFWLRIQYEKKCRIFCEFSALDSQTSLRRETVGAVAKMSAVSQAKNSLKKKIGFFVTFLQFFHYKEWKGWGLQNSMIYNYFMLLLFRASGTAVKALPILFCFAYSLITSEKNSDFVVWGSHHGISIWRRIHCLRVQTFHWMRQRTLVQTLMGQAISCLFIQWITDCLFADFLKVNSIRYRSC